MTYYDYATAMAFELDRWGNDRTPRNFEREAIIIAQRRSARFEQEAIACQQHRSTQRIKIQSVIMRCVSEIRSIRFKDTLDTP